MRYILNKGSDRPKVVGFYWAKCVGVLSGRQYETVVKITTGIGQSKSDRPTSVFWDGTCVQIDNEHLLAFAGPIPRPEE